MNATMATQGSPAGDVATLSISSSSISSSSSSSISSSSSSSASVGNILDILNDDALQAVLLRTCAADHKSLSLTCHQIRNVLDSPIYKKDRWTSGWAQTRVDTSGDNHPYMEDDFGTIGHSGTILVDCMKAGTLSFTLVPRQNTRNFHEACDSVSEELQSVGCTFCDNWGRPRLNSVKKATEGEGEFVAMLNNAAQYFFYIDTFELSEDYRHSSNTLIGATALRSLLMDHRNLENMWSLAVYIPEGSNQFTKADDEKAEEMKSETKLEVNAREELSCIEVDMQRNKATAEEGQKQVQLYRDLTRQDMRQFLRAGFQQATETIKDSNCLHVFCVPSLFEDTPIMTHEEALSMKIVERRAQSAGPTGKSKDLLDFMISACHDRREYTNTIRAWRVPSEHRSCRQTVAEITDKRRQLTAVTQSIDSKEEQLSAAKQERDALADLIREGAESAEHLRRLEGQLSTMNDEVAAVQKDFDSMGSSRIEKEELMETIREKEERLDRLGNKITEKAEKDRSELDARVKSTVTNLLDKGEEQTTVLESNAIHACAANWESDYIELLLEFVSPPERKNAVNTIDHAEATPLMQAAATISHNTDTDCRYMVCKRLVELGADKDIVDHTGRTALGHFYAGNRSVRDMSHLFRLSKDTLANEVRQMKLLLTPFKGATAADEAEVDEEYDDGFDGDEMIEEDDDEMMEGQ